MILMLIEHSRSVRAIIAHLCHWKPRSVWVEMEGKSTNPDPLQGNLGGPGKNFGLGGNGGRAGL